MTALSTPKVELKIWFFQSRPATTGMIRKGVMSSVRAMPRPKNWRSSRSARPVPTSSDRSTAAVRHEHGDHDRVEEELVGVALGEVLQADEVRSPGRDDRPVLEAEPDVEEEGDLRHHDGEQQGGQEGQPAAPLVATLERPRSRRPVRRPDPGFPSAPRVRSRRLLPPPLRSPGVRLVPYQDWPDDLRCDGLAGGQGVVDGDVAGDGRRELLRAARARRPGTGARPRTARRAGPGEAAGRGC